ncbi:hypothetical protein chiPu_0017831 [Chiloscyllium punctatum]|uniref:Doublecortin domain-containing protein n=1 Tax=Chiloscyllium punctatum TaxID=137246 RepID=A0A401RJ63_CHIPU|nr:hypothetical protein [Chiloscyllium punctatum]
MASAGTPLVPQAKNVVVFRNGDPFFTGRKFVVNQRQILTFESFLNEVTNNINAPVAVRNIYTPSGGHRVLQLNDLQNGSHYVAAGFEKFKKIDYLQNGNPKPKENRGKIGITVRAVYSNRVNVSARWKKYIPIPCIVHIFRNGDVLNPPFRLIIPKHVMTNWDKILAMITEKAKIQTGAVRRSVFKVSEKRAELQGAQEIPDDENTKVELPIDKRVAETVEDEVIPEEETISY